MDIIRPARLVRFVPKAGFPIASIAAGSSRSARRRSRLLRESRQRWNTIIRCSGLHSDQSHRDKAIVAYDSNDIHNAALAELIQRSRVDVVRDLLVAIKRDHEIIERGFVVLHLLGTDATSYVVDDLRIEPSLQR